MSSRRLLEGPSDVKALAERLSKCAEVTRYDDGDEREAWELAHCFRYLEDSFRKFLEDQLARLTAGDMEAPMTYDLLLDIGDELREILSLIKATKFYRYLHGEDPD